MCKETEEDQKDLQDLKKLGEEIKFLKDKKVQMKL